jgi:hypothetical protein
MSFPGLLPAAASVPDAPTGPATLLPLLGHTLHWTLTFGGLLALLALLVASRPGRATPVRRPAEVRRRQLALLVSATASGPGAAVHAGGGAGTPRLDAAPATAGRATASTASAADHTWLPVAVVSSAAAAGVHAAAGPEHLREGLLVGGFFVVSALAQLAWAAVVMLAGPTRRLLHAALVGNAAVVVIWLASRTVGLPGGLVEVEAVGPWDLAATAWEVAVIAGVSLVLSSGRFTDTDVHPVDIVRWSAAARGWLLASVALMVVLTVAGASG